MDRKEYCSGCVSYKGCNLKHLKGECNEYDPTDEAVYCQNRILSGASEANYKSQHRR